MKQNMFVILLILVLGLFIVGCNETIVEEPVEPVEDSTETIETDSDINEDVYVEVPVEEVSEDVDEEIMVTASGVKYLVNPNKILSGGPPMDGIPSLDNPKYVSLEEADEWIEDNELVLAIIYKGVKRVYPLQILVWHEIVNDHIAGDPLLITYCPLCGSGIAFEGKIDINGERKEVEFGTSGKLYNSNLVMYDRETQSYWTQIDGKAIIGELTGQELVEVSIDTVVWRDWKKVHPDSEVLSQKTGHLRNYGKDPYGSYYENSNLFFPVENEDDRIHPKDVIFGVEVDGVYKAYREDDLIAMGMIEDTVNGITVKVERDEAGIVTIMNVDTDKEIIKERDFWFAWYAFHPETGLYEVK
ncbi:DUF3179 domain-containing protein [Candidatus Woesearchaeota archaeon]|jgi:hypothetical protein|nr:DUF3179 domain-containing protein [Candidatus Woesearchaeota archaeon]MBT4376198.1 DUF3179 domain-containing protein [archaeon]MBT4805734.1 DUF3179 domain-containing protein [Candidatus Woesearchaeota archaeon]MBT5343124.1 DUF3179 domain-containing protein [Candidatus Woesearchaeota archaeon]MBT6774985.1 DUF3179 domain-containing protein [Candidatus Woesearchaeota archaeon]